VKKDEVMAGDVMNCNFAINHQYVDGANITKVKRLQESLLAPIGVFKRIV
jgi:hypothetical protein